MCVPNPCLRSKRKNEKSKSHQRCGILRVKYRTHGHGVPLTHSARVSDEDQWLTVLVKELFALSQALETVKVFTLKKKTVLETVGGEMRRVLQNLFIVYRLGHGFSKNSKTMPAFFPGQTPACFFNLRLQSSLSCLFLVKIIRKCYEVSSAMQAFIYWYMHKSGEKQKSFQLRPTCMSL